MTKIEAIFKAMSLYGYSFETIVGNDHMTVVRVRHKCVVFPEIGVDGSIRDFEEWALIDSAEKIDSGMYGSFRYFS